MLLDDKMTQLIVDNFKEHEISMMYQFYGERIVRAIVEDAYKIVKERNKQMKITAKNKK